MAMSRQSIPSRSHIGVGVWRWTCVPSAARSGSSHSWQRERRTVGPIPAASPSRRSVKGRRRTNTPRRIELAGGYVWCDTNMTPREGGMAGHQVSRRLREKIAVEQGGVCALCGTEGRLELDHDHGTCHPGERGCPFCVRGLLCGPCNTDLGAWESGIYPVNPERIPLYAAYAASPPASRALAGYRAYVRTFRDSVAS